MSNQTVLLEALASLQDCFPRQEMRAGTIQAYGAMLADIPQDILIAAIHRVVARSKFFPTIAEIREVAAEILIPLPTKDEFLAEVAKQRQNVRDRKRAGFGLQAFQDAIEALGGWDIMMQGSLEPYERAQLGAAYDAIRRKTQEMAILGSMSQLSAQKPAVLMPPPEASWERDVDGRPVNPDKIGSYHRLPDGSLYKSGSHLLPHAY